MGFFVTVIVLLALGIGGNVAIFSIVNAVLLRPLPYVDPDGLVLLWGNVQRTVVERRGASAPDYLDWKQQNRSFEDLASFWNVTLTMRGADERVPVQSEVVGAGYFGLLGVQPVLGRDFRPEEEINSALTPVVILAHEFWTQHLGADPAVLGNQILLDATNYTVVGVMPRGFRGVGDRAQAWIPSASLRQQPFTDRGARGLVVLGRLRSGVTLAQAQAEMDKISQSLEHAYPQTNEKRGAEVVSLAVETFGNVKPALIVLLSAVSMVLLIVCANVANLMLLRNEARESEIAIRKAVGASRGELLKLIVAEALLLCFIGAVIGVLFSSLFVDLVLTLSPIQLPSFVNVSLDGNVVVFAVALAGITAFLMAIAPALQCASSNLAEALNSNSGRTTRARSAKRLRHGIVIAEIALSFVLLLTAGLLMESFRHLLHVDTGFQTENLLTFRLGLDSQGATKPAAIREALEGLAGVRSVALSSVIPFSGGPAVFYNAEGAEPPADATTAPRAYIHFVSPWFFQTMGIPLLSGRDFDLTEPSESVIVSEKVAKRFWPGQDPIGKRVRIARNNPDNPWLNIVGVVRDTKSRGIPDNPTPDPDIYFPFGVFGGTPGVLVRTDVKPQAVVASVVNEIRRLDKLAVVSSVSAMEDLIQPRMARSRFLSALSGVFSIMALVLALVGIYGSMSCTVAQETRELGIRIALGANRGRVLRMVLGRSLFLIGGGLALGFIGSIFASQAIASLLYGIEPTSPAVFIGAAALMIVAGLGAAYIPARRAAFTDPLNALRQE